MVAKRHSSHSAPLAVHSSNLAPTLGHSVKHLHRVKPFLTIVAADGIEPVLHHGDSNPRSEHRHRLGIAPTTEDWVVDLHSAAAGSQLLFFYCRKKERKRKTSTVLRQGLSCCHKIQLWRQNQIQFIKNLETQAWLVLLNLAHLNELPDLVCPPTA